MSSQKFRARAINASKQIPIYWDNEVPDMSECTPSTDVNSVFLGMEKEEQYEHHLLAKIFEGRVIPVPDVTRLEGDDYEDYNRMYPTNHKFPKQLIRMDPFAIEENVSNYDADVDDEMWINTQAKDLGITLDKFEYVIDKLENMSQYSIVTLEEAIVSLEENEELVTCIYDYWQNKRLKTQQPLIPTIPHDNGVNTKNTNPYVAFRRPFSNMQTRRNKKNDEKLYVKVMKIQRDLQRLLKLLEMVKQREASKKDLQLLSLQIFEKRYAAEDWSGQFLDQVTNDQVLKPLPTVVVSDSKVTDDEGPFSFRRRKDCNYLPPRRFDRRDEVWKSTFNGVFGRGDRLMMYRNLTTLEDNAFTIQEHESIRRLHPGNVIQARGMQMFQPRVPFISYLPSEEEVSENKQLNVYRVNDKELVLCSELNKVTIEDVLREGIVNDTTSVPVEAVAQEESSTVELSLSNWEEMFASIEISNLMNNTGSNSSNDYTKTEDTVGSSTFIM